MGRCARLVELQTQEVFYSLQGMDQMNTRIKAIKTHYYTVFDCLGSSQTSLTYAYMSVFNRWPNTLPVDSEIEKLP